MKAKAIKVNSILELQCPAGHKMVLRSGRYGKFYGCSNYPRCKFTVNFNEATKLFREFAEPEVIHTFEPSHYQATIFAWIEDWVDGTASGSQHLVVKADAGSGKTTTALQALRLLPKDDKILFSCFNKNIAEELSRKAPSWVSVGTLHSIGFAALKNALPIKHEVDDSKVWNIIKELLPDYKYQPLHTTIRKLVSLVKATLTDPTDTNAIQDLATKYNVELNGNAEVILDVVPKIIRLCLERTYVIDYNDMIWLPVVMELPLGQYDWVFIDEEQDITSAQLELVIRLVNSTGHIVGIGDEKQSIYGFRGADVDAIPNIIERLDADTLPLGISYRNAKAILDHVKEQLPHVTTEAAPWAKEGAVRHATYDKMMLEAKDGDLILCRVNAPLVKACYSFIRQGHKAVIRGRDIGKSLLSFIDKLKPTDLHDLIVNITKYRYTQTAKLVLAGKKERLAALHDRCDTLHALCEGARDLSDLRHSIKHIFNDVQKRGIILSSVHRAKGDEANRVFILEPGLMPHPLAKAPWQQAQEMNIKYVALTRAKEELVYVDG